MVEIIRRGTPRLRYMAGVFGAALLAACGTEEVDDLGTGASDPAALAAAECNGQAEAWDIGFAADAEGEATPEEAIEHAENTAPSPMPRGEPVEVSRTSNHLDYAFLEADRYAGSATVRNLNDTWLVEAAVVCR